MRPALRIDALWKSYTAGVRGCSARVWVLRGLSLTVSPGERVVIVGAAGAGKSTLASCILGLRRPDAGAVDAPALESGHLVVVGPGTPPSPRTEPVAHHPAMLLLVEELTDVRVRADRFLRLRDGLLHPLDECTPLRRVAERMIDVG